MMPRFLAAALAAFAAAALALPAFGPAAEFDPVRRKQQTQEKAREMTRELISGILDVQLRQLEENNLQELKIYDEIKSMRANIDVLVREEMKGVVELLVKVQEAPEKERPEAMKAAREKIRGVVITLMAERQKLLKRLQLARLAEQIKAVIALETRTRNVTKGLPELPQNSRDAQHLTAIDDQKDVSQLYGQLKGTLTDVSTWGGVVGAGAAEGLKILKAGDCDRELIKALEGLAGSQFLEAAKAQRKVIAALTALLEKIEETRGLISSDREAALKLVRELLAKQEELRKQVKADPLNERKIEEFVEKQSQIYKELANLQQALDKWPTTTPLVEQARASAYEASGELFENKQAEAVAEQSKVIGALAQIEEQLRTAVEQERADKSADELAAQVEQLKEAQKGLEKASEPQKKAEEIGRPEAGRGEGPAAASRRGPEGRG